MTVPTTARTGAALRLRVLTGVSVTAMLMSGGAAAQVSTDVGIAAAQKRVDGNNTIVTTTNRNGTVAFNQFDKLNVGAGDEVTLVLPSGTRALVNSVKERMFVDGTISSRLENPALTDPTRGTIGGSLYFVTPSGLVMGASGRINTGNLVIRGATADLLDDQGLVRSDAASRALAGGAADLVTLGGTIAAPGGIDVKAARVEIKAGGKVLSGIAGRNELVSQGLLVSTEGLVEGAQIIAGADGSIRIAAEGDVVMAAGAGSTLDARQVAFARPGSSSTARTSGGVSISGSGRIELRGTIDAGAEGDVVVANSHRATASLNPFYADVTSAASVSIDGAVTGRNVSITAQSEATAETDESDLGQAAVAAAARLASPITQRFLNADLNGFVSLVKTDATIAIGADTVIKASRDLSLAATTVASSAAEANAIVEADDSSSVKFGIAAVYAEVQSKAAISASARSRMTAGGALKLKTDNDSRSTAKVVAESSGNGVSAAFAINNVDVDSSIDIAQGAAVSGNTVAMSATIGQTGDGAPEPKAGFITNAKSVSTDGGYGGGAAAVSLQDVSARVTVAGAVTATGAVDIGSTSVTERNTTNAAVTAGTGLLPDLKRIPTTESAAISDTIDIVGNFIIEKAIAKDQAEKPETPKFNIGATLGLTIADHGAQTDVTGTIFAGGAVKLDGSVNDKFARTGSAATISAKPGAESKAAIAGAVSYSETSYDASATLGRDAAKPLFTDVAAGSLSVTSKVSRPFSDEIIANPVTDDVEYLEFFETSVADRLSKTFGVEKGVFNNAAGAKSVTKADGSYAISGSVGWQKVNADSVARIGDNVQLALGGPLKVLAANDLVTLNLGGAIPSVTDKLAGANKSPGAAGGASVGYLELNPVTTAVLGAGVKVSGARVDTEIDATARIRALNLTPASGEGGIGIAGTFSWTEVEGRTEALIGGGGDLQLGAGTLDVDAETDAEIWSVAGALTTTQGGTKAVGVGVSGAVNNVDLETRAAFLPGAVRATVGAAGVSVDALTTGSLNALSVTGSIQNTTPAQRPKEPSGEAGYGSKMKFYAASLLSVATEKLGAKALAATAEAIKQEGENAKKVFDEADKAGSKPAPDTSFGVAGSASVNIASIDTTIEASKVDFTRTGQGAFRATAAEGVEMLSLTGGATIAAGKPAPNGSFVIAGAYGLSQSNNRVRNAFSDTRLLDWGSVAIEALINGTRIGAGLALAAVGNASTKGFAVAGSISQLLSYDGASASFEDGEISRTGDGSLDGSTVAILAHDGQKLGAGAAALGIGTNTSFGGSFTVIEALPGAGAGAADAILRRSSVSGYQDLSVRAINASLIASAAVAGGLSQGDKPAGAVAFNYNVIDRNTAALIDFGTSSTASVNVTGTVTVASGDVATPTGVAVAGVKTCLATAAPCLTVKSFDAGILTSGQESGDPSPPTLRDLTTGSQIYAVALPVAGSSGAQAAGVAFSWNEIDNDRSAAVTGNGLAGRDRITAGNLSVRSSDKASILSVAAGAAISGDKHGGGLGSVAINTISGDASALVQGSNGFGVTLTRPGTAENLLVEARGDGQILSVSGAIAGAQKKALGFAVSVNEIGRNPSDKAGLFADLSGVRLTGANASVLAVSDAKIDSTAFGVSKAGVAVAGAATANLLSPTISATASRLDYATRAAGDLIIRATDTSAIESRALLLSSGGALSLLGGVAVNRIDADLVAGLRHDSGRIDVRNLVVGAGATATTRTIGLGAASGALNIAGSIAVNITNSDADALLDLRGGTIEAVGSVGVLAVRDSEIDALSGAGASGTAAIGASIVVNEVGGGASARIAGTGAGSITASADNQSAADRTLANVRTGAIADYAQGDVAGSITNVTDLYRLAAASVKDKAGIASYQGVVVSASSTHRNRVLAITGAEGDAGTGGSLAATAIVSNLGGKTDASVSNADIRVGAADQPGANDALGLHVLAGTHAAGVSFAGALSTGAFAGSAPIVSDGYTTETNATVSGGALRSAGKVEVRADSSLAASALVIAGALSRQAGAAAISTVTPRFGSTTNAQVTTPQALVARGGAGVNITAKSANRGQAFYGALALSSGAGGGAGIVVALNDSQTSAGYRGRSDALVEAPQVRVIADGDYDATVIGGAVGVGKVAGIAGNIVAAVDRSEISATADGLNYFDDAGRLDVLATGDFGIGTKVAQIGVAETGAAVAAGAIVVLSQGKIDATLNQANVLARDIAIKATGLGYVDARQLGIVAVAKGLAANVALTYVGVGQVARADTGALFGNIASDTADRDRALAQEAGAEGGRNGNIEALRTGTIGSDKAAGASDTARIGTNGALSDAEAQRIAAPSRKSGAPNAQAAFASLGALGDTAAASRVRARVTSLDAAGRVVAGGSQVGAIDSFAIDSDAKLSSTIDNITGTVGGFALAATGTIGIMRNAQNSFAEIGAGVYAYGTNGHVRALNGDGGSEAARIDLVGGSAAAAAVSVAVADARLDTLTSAASAGRLTFAGRFDVTAEDKASVKTSAIGVTAGVGALNAVVASSEKTSRVNAGIAGNIATGDGVDAQTVKVIAKGGGSSAAKAIAGSGGVMFAGNAAVALAKDSRAVRAQIAENSFVSAGDLTVAGSMTPNVKAESFGIAVSGGVAAGASVAQASAAGSVNAAIGEGGEIYGRPGACAEQPCRPTITLSARAERPDGGGDNAQAIAHGSAGGVFYALNAASAIAQLDTATSALLGADLAGTTPGAALRIIGSDYVLTGYQEDGTPILTSLPASALTVEAVRAGASRADASGVTLAGSYGLGVSRAEARSGGTSDAGLLNVDAVTGLGAVKIASASDDANHANTVAGAGALGAGVASLAVTGNSSRVTTRIAPPASLPLASESLTATALAKSSYDVTSDSGFAALVGGSGTTSTNNINTSAEVVIGQAAAARPAIASRLTSGSFNIEAKNLVAQGNAAADGAGGGAVSGAAALVDNNITQRAAVSVLDGVKLRQYGGERDGNTILTAINAEIGIAAAGKVKLDIGGAMALPFAKLNATYRPTASVTIGADALIRGDSAISAGTRIAQNTSETGLAKIYGLAGVGGASTRSTTIATESLTVGDRTTIESMQDVLLSAGRSAGGLATSLAPTTTTDTFNYTVLPLDTDADADTNVSATTAMTLGTATIRSARDVIVDAMPAAVSARADGTGHNPYLTLFRQTSDGGNVDSKSSGALTLNGTQLTAGFLATRTIRIEDCAAGSPGCVTENGVTYRLTSNDTDPDPDRLGRFYVTGTQFDPVTQLDLKIGTPAQNGVAATGLMAKAAADQISVPADPALFSDTAAPSEIQRTQLAALGIAVPANARAAQRLLLVDAAGRFPIVAEIAQLYETRAALKSSAAEAGRAVATAGVLVDQVYAGGGVLEINTGNIGGGNARAVANGAPSMTITNDSSNNLLLGRMLIPSKPTGLVSFGGGAGRAQLEQRAAVSTPGDTGSDGRMLITSGAANGSNPLANMIALGDIANIGGLFKATVNNGDFVQFGAVGAATYSVAVPNGLFVISANENGAADLGSPYLYYYGNAGLSLYASQGSTDLGVPGRAASITPLNASFYVANYLVKRDLDRASGVPIGSGFLFPTYTGTVLARGSGTGAFGNAPYNPAGGYGTNGDPGVIVTNYFGFSPAPGSSTLGLDAAGNRTRGPRTAVVWGGCSTNCEFASDDGDLNATGITHENRYFRQGWVNFNDGGDRDVYGNAWRTPIVETMDLVPGSFSTANLPTRYRKPGERVTALNVLIDAKYVNISGDIVAGPTKTRTLAVHRDGEVVLATGAAQGVQPIGKLLAGATYNSEGEVLITRPLATRYFPFFGSELSLPATAQVTSGDLSARFVKTGDPVNGIAQGYIEVDPIAAGAGGSISITGRILNTNPLSSAATAPTEDYLGGRLKVLNGFATINIFNHTDYDLHVSTINAGVDPTGRISLTDLSADGSVKTTLYTNAPGEGVRVDQIARTVQYHPLTGFPLTDSSGSRVIVTTQSSTTYTDGTGLANGKALFYNPQGQAYYSWTDTRVLQRTVNKVFYADRDDVRLWSVTPWEWAPGGTAPTGGRFLDLSDPNVIFNHETDEYRLRYALKPTALGLSAPEQMVQIVSGETLVGQDNALWVNGAYRYDGPQFDWQIPTKARINVLTAVKATYPIAVQFDNGGSSPGIFITSLNGRVVLDGQMTSAGGAVSVRTLKSLTQSPGANILANNLNLEVVEGVGSAAQPIRATLTATAKLQPVVYANTDLGSINLDLLSLARLGGQRDSIAIGRVWARDAVNITTDGSLSAVDFKNNGLFDTDANIVGRTVNIVAGGSVGGDIKFAGANVLDRRGLAIDINDSLDPNGTGSLSIKAGGDIDVRTAYHADKNEDLRRVLRIGRIEAGGDVILRVGGSVVAKDATATVDPVKLAKLNEAYEDLRLKSAPCPAGVANCAIIEPEQRAEIERGIRGLAESAFDRANLTEEEARGRATADAVGRINALNLFRRDAVASGATIEGGRSVVLGAMLDKSDPLYRLALDTLRSRNEAVTLPSLADLQRGLQLHFDGLRAPLAQLFPTSIPTLNLLPAAGEAGADKAMAAALAKVAAAIKPAALEAYRATQQSDGRATLAAIFGAAAVPTSREAIATAALDSDYLSRRLTGATWTDSQLGFAIPSSAFLPVADTQFETRAPVITARNLFIATGDSIGSFDAAKTFVFDRNGLQGLTGTEAEKQAQRNLANAYFATSGPGDLVARIDYLRNSAGALAIGPDGKPVVTAASFTTRRDQPLQIAITGTLNALAGTMVQTLQEFTGATPEGYGITTAAPETVRGNIFVNNIGALTIGNIISQKSGLGETYVRQSDGTVLNPCAVGTVTFGCDSRIRLTAASLTGATGSTGLDGAPRIGNGFIGNLHDINGGGSALVMGGLVRLEASNGSIGGADGGNLLVDTRALETIRAAGDVRLEKRSPVTVKVSGYTWRTYSDDLIVGDAFAGGRLQIDNPHGSLLVGAVPSNVASENRNGRLIAGTLALRALGDLGSDGLTAAGLPGRFDITAPRVEALVAGYQFARGQIRTEETDNADQFGYSYPEGRGYFMLRGRTAISGLIGARRSLDFEIVDNASSIVSFDGPIGVSDHMTITTARPVTFGSNLLVDRPGTGAVAGVQNLSLLRLNLLGGLGYRTAGSLRLGEFRSGGGSLIADGALAVGTARALGGANLLVSGRSGLTIGAVEGAAVTLASAAGNVTLTGAANAASLAISGADVAAANLIGGSARITATRSAKLSFADLTGSLSVTAAEIDVAGGLAADQELKLAATGTIRLSDSGGLFDAQRLDLRAQTLAFAPQASIGIGGDAIITQTGTAAMALPYFFGRSLQFSTVGNATIEQIGTTGAMNLAAGGGLNVYGTISSGGDMVLKGSSVSLFGFDQVVSGGALRISAVTGDISSYADLRSGGAANLTAHGMINVGALIANGGAARSTTSDVIVRNDLILGTRYDIVAGRNVVLGSYTNLGGKLAIAAKGDVTLADYLTLRPGVEGTALQVTADGTVRANPFAYLQGGRGAGIIINAGGVAFDPSSQVSAFAMTIKADGDVQLGDVLGDSDQVMSLRSTAGRLTAGVVNGSSVRMEGATAVAVGSIQTQAATLISAAGGVAIAGDIEVNGTATSKLAVTAAQGLSFGGRLSATGGLVLTAASIRSNGSGALSDLLRPGATIQLRADTIDVAFDTGTGAGAAAKLDVRGRTTTMAELAVLRFFGDRAIGFETLAAARASLVSPQPLTIKNLQMRDYLRLASRGGSALIVGLDAAGQTANRTINTGPLTGARISLTPGQDGVSAPRILINNILR